VLFYLSTSPDYFGPITTALAKAGLTTEANGRWRRVVVEKPFGRDLASARALNAELRGVLDERQIYRIDHYLGKETVQNLLVFRFANGIFEPVWNRRYVDHVQITVAETLGVEKRGGYYDGTGALRDMVPNHIFQLISLTAMEPPISFDADAVRDEQTKVLKAMTRFTPEDVLQRTVRGQYGAGSVGGAAVPDYRAEANVAPKSNTETYVAMKLGVDNWRWMGVPFYLRVGEGARLALDGGRDPVQGAAVHPLPQHRRRVVEAQPARDPHPARREHLARVRREGAGRDGPHRGRGHGLSLHGPLRLAPRDGLRAPAPRRDARRPDALPAGRHGRGFVDGRGPDSRHLEGLARAAVPELRRGHDGAGRSRRPARQGRAHVVADRQGLILAGDIGGTNARFAAFDPAREPCEPVWERTVPSRSAASFLDVLRTVRPGIPGPVVAACFGVAGPVRHGVCRATNLPWVIDAGEVARELSLASVGLLNDLEASAWGVEVLRGSDFETLQAGAPDPDGATALVSAGTGLGEAGMIVLDGVRRAFACEGGHSSFSPVNEREVRLWRRLAATHGHVSWERVLSGPGLVAVYEFVRDEESASDAGPSPIRRARTATAPRS